MWFSYKRAPHSNRNMLGTDLSEVTVSAAATRTVTRVVEVILTYILDYGSLAWDPKNLSQSHPSIARQKV